MRPETRRDRQYPNQVFSIPITCFQRNCPLKRRRAMGKSGVNQVKCDTVSHFGVGLPNHELDCFVVYAWVHAMLTVDIQLITWLSWHQIKRISFPSQLLSQLCLLLQLPFGERKVSTLEVGSAPFPWGREAWVRDIGLLSGWEFLVLRGSGLRSLGPLSTGTLQDPD